MPLTLPWIPSSSTSVAPPSRGAIGNRLSLSLSDPTPAFVNSSNSLYFVPYSQSDCPGQISLFNGTEWKMYDCPLLTLVLSGLAANTNYDVFAYSLGNSVFLECYSWVNDTTRSALWLIDNILHKAGTSSRYIGSFRTTAADTIVDTENQRFLINAFNQTPCKIKKVDSTVSWVCNVTSFRPTNNSAANRVEVLSIFGNQLLNLNYHQSKDNASNYRIAIAENNIAKFDVAPHGNLSPYLLASFNTCPRQGFSTYQMLECTTAGVATTCYGANGNIASGLLGDYVK